MKPWTTTAIKNTRQYIPMGSFWANFYRIAILYRLLDLAATGLVVGSILAHGDKDWCVTIMAPYRRYQHRGPSWNEITTMTESFPCSATITQRATCSYQCLIECIWDIWQTYPAASGNATTFFISLHKPPRSSQGSIKIQETHPRVFLGGTFKMARSRSDS